MSYKKKSVDTRVGLSSLIFIVFLFLKLSEIGVVATWSWLWVTSPLWIPFVLILGLIGIFIIVTIIMVLIFKLVSIITND